MVWRSLTVALAMILSNLAAAQIKYTRNGGTAADLPANNTIDIGTISSLELIHVYDSVGVDDSIVGPLIIRGRVLSGGSLRLQVVSQFEADAFDQEPTQENVVGLRNLGGIEIQSTIANDTSLRDHTIVSVSVQGDILGDIDVAQIYRIDAVQSENGAFGGTIAGNITAHQLNNSVISNRTSINYLRAGRLISGSITALSPAYDHAFRSPNADISRLIVGPVASQGI